MFGHLPFQSVSLARCELALRQVPGLPRRRQGRRLEEDLGPAVPDHPRGRPPGTQTGTEIRLSRIFSGREHRRRRHVSRLLLLRVPLRDGNPCLCCPGHAKGIKNTSIFGTLDYIAG